MSHTWKKSYLQLWILHIVLRLVELGLIEAVGDPQRSVGHEQNGELELGNKLPWAEMKWRGEDGDERCADMKKR